MNDESAFLKTIVESPFDVTPRLVYADWLEERGDPRAEFLRIQQELRSPLTDQVKYRELCHRERDLIKTTDPEWVQRIRTYTTPQPCRDIASLVPEIAQFASSTVRLHPHRIVGNQLGAGSKIGGFFLWPTNEEWPICPHCRIPLVQVLQLRSYDVPGISFYNGADLFQLFWCINEEAHGYQPVPTVHWRSAAAITNARTEMPQFEEYVQRDDIQLRRSLLPHPCSIFPEKVVEFPGMDDLAYLAGSNYDQLQSKITEMDLGPLDDLGDRFESENALSDPWSLFVYELGKCPGSRAGGRPSYNDEKLFEHFVTIPSWEFDGASFRRWLPLEDRRLFETPGEQLTFQQFFHDSDYDKVHELQEPHRMVLGRTQSMHLYVCRQDDPWSFTISIYD